MAFILLLAPALLRAQAPDLWSAVQAANDSLQPRQYLYHHTAGLKGSVNPIKMGLRTAMFVYQKKITYQVAGNCLYVPSCSEFSRECFEEYGLLKASMLTLDRLSRCSPLMLRYLSRFDKVPGDGHLHYSDPPALYKSVRHEKDRD